MLLIRALQGFLRPRRKRRNFCCARGLAQLQTPSKPVKASGSCGGRISKGSFSKLKGVRPGLPFASLFPKRLAKACHGAPLSWIGRRLPNAKCTAAFSIVRLKRGSASAQRAPCLGLENSSMKGQQLHSHRREAYHGGYASRLFGASAANLPASRAQRQVRPHLFWCKAAGRRQGGPF